MKSEQELDAEARRIRRLAEQDLEDLNAGRTPQPSLLREALKDILWLLLIFTIILGLFWSLTGCLTIETRTVRVVAIGSVKKATVSPTGEVSIEEASSSLDRITDGLSNTGMFAWITKAFGR